MLGWPLCIAPWRHCQPCSCVEVDGGGMGATESAATSCTSGCASPPVEPSDDALDSLTAPRESLVPVDARDDSLLLPELPATLPASAASPFSAAIAACC